MGKTSKDDFEYFSKCVSHYYDKFKLSGWHVYYIHKPLDDHAQLGTNVSKRCATFYLSKRLSVKVTKKRLKAIAKHEVVHLLTAMLYAAAWDRFSKQSEITGAEGELVQHLTELL